MSCRRLPPSYVRGSSTLRSREKLWSLPIEESEMSTQQLAWLLELPWWRGTGGQVFTVRPIDVTAGPRYQRTTQADLSWPLHVTQRHGRFLVLDGFHRLLKATWLGLSAVRVLDVPPDALAEIAV
jgi:hypothetical protein